MTAAKRLDGRSALITGAGSGFGAEIARRYAAEGARVAVNDLRDAAAQRTVDAIVEAGGTAIAVPGDVTESRSVSDMIRRCVAAFGRMDILVLNAGVPQRPTPIEDIPDAIFDAIFDTNVRSLYLGVRFAVPQFKAQGGGNVIITASTIASRPRPGLGLYAASKGAALSLMKAMAVELAPLKVLVNALCPSAGDTPMLKEFMGGADTAEARKLFASRVPLVRLCTPKDVADTALFLASDEAGFLTGIAIDIDGGRSI
jgi:3-oxoacyl-[acyl-carrier protein] reductase